MSALLKQARTASLDIVYEETGPAAGKPADVAAAMIFLASDRCQFATGSDFVLDGGAIAQGNSFIERLYGTPGPVRA